MFSIALRPRVRPCTSIPTNPPRTLTRPYNPLLSRRLFSSSGDVSRDRSQTVIHLRNELKGNDVFVVGTAHVSYQSAEEVKELIQKIKPATVVLELDKKRADEIRKGIPQRPEDLLNRLPAVQGMFGQGSAGGMDGTFQGFFALLRNMGLASGLEFKVALQEADRLGIPVVYGDMELTSVMARLAKSFSLMDLMAMASKISAPPPQEIFTTLAEMKEDLTRGNFPSMAEKLKNREKVRALTKYFSTILPKVTEVLIHERDLHLIKELKAANGPVLGVVGIAHLDGIEEYWNKAPPSKSSWLNWLKK